MDFSSPFIPYHASSGEGRLRHLVANADAFFQPEQNVTLTTMSRRHMLRNVALAGAGFSSLCCPSQTYAAAPIGATLIHGGLDLFKLHAAPFLRRMTEEIAGSLACEALLRGLHWCYEDLFKPVLSNGDMRRSFRDFFISFLQTCEKFFEAARIAAMTIAEQLEEFLRSPHANPKRSIVRQAQKKELDFELGRKFTEHTQFSDQVLLDKFDGENRRFRTLQVVPDFNKRYGGQHRVGWYKLMRPAEFNIAELIFLFGYNKEGMPLVFDPKAAQPIRKGVRDVIPITPRQPWELPRRRTRSSFATTEKMNKALNELNSAYTKKGDSNIEHKDVLYTSRLVGVEGKAHTGFGVAKNNTLKYLVVDIEL